MQLEKNTATATDTPSGITWPVYLGLIVLAGAALRMAFLADKSLWYDEAVSVGIARLGWHDFRRIITNSEANMSFYYLLLRFWTQLGDSEFVVRSFSVLSGVGTLLCTGIFVQRFFGRATALTATALLAVNVFHIRYSQEARGYSLVTLLVTISMLLFAEAITAPSGRKWGWYILTSFAAIYSHFFAGFVLAAQWASLLFVSPGRIPWRDLRKAIVWLGLLTVPAFYFIFTKNHGQIAWIQPTSQQKIYDLFFVLSGRGGVVLLLTYAFLSLFGIAAAFASWKREKHSNESWGFSLVVSWLFAPIILTLLLSLWKPVLLPRYLIVSTPALATLAALGLSRIRWKWLSVTAFGIVIGFSLAALPSYYSQGFDPPRDHWRDVTSYILSNSHPGDAIAFYHPFSRLPFEYYRSRLKRLDDPDTVFPLRGDALLLVDSTSSKSALLAPEAPVMQDLSCKHQRIWLVVSYGPDAVIQNFKILLGEKYSTVSERHFGIVQVFLYSR